MLSYDRHRAALACCRPDGTAPPSGHRVREALGRLAVDVEFWDEIAAQNAFDAHLVSLVQALPLPDTFAADVAEGRRRAAVPEAPLWRRAARQPAAWAVLLAVLFLAAWAGWTYYEHTLGFAGDDTVRQIVESTRRGRRLADHIEPLATECSRLGDTLFLQYGLDGYDVPPPFDHDPTTGYRVFAKNESFVAQIEAVHRGRPLTLLLFRAAKQGVGIEPPERWKFLDGEDWSAAVQVRNRVGFVAVDRGKDRGKWEVR